ncbi:MFS transporter [Nocardia sp. NPDC051750]|uniref:MFS transporter n=1 Tax=Nocardia sp. NPDC051750 TaxID=3364325 RepID=UPI0037AD25E4
MPNVSATCDEQNHPDIEVLMTLTPFEEPPADGPSAGDHPLPTRSGLATGESATITPAGPRYVVMMIFAVFGVYMAFVTPIAISLAIRVEQLAPGREQYLGYIAGAGGLAAVLTGPLIGRLSDGLRNRFGRRRPVAVVGMVVGILGLLVMAQSPNILVLCLGWVIAQAGFNGVITVLLASQADRLAPTQRGRVSAMLGVVQHLAPVAGALIAGSLSSNTLALFLVPGIVAMVAVGLFVLAVPEPDTRHAKVQAGPVGLRSLVGSFTFDPRRSPDFAWNWLGKFLFMLAVTFNTTFTAFFIASRMDVSVEEVSGVVAIMAGGALPATMLGALGGGFLSDRLQRRRVFVLVGGSIFAVGAIIMALAPSVPVIIAGVIIGNLGLGLFASVDMALMLDVIPDRETDAGRYVGIYQFSTAIPQGVAPFIAPLFLLIGADGDDKNYTLLYLVAAALAVVSGLLVATRIKSVR